MLHLAIIPEILFQNWSRVSEFSLLACIIFTKFWFCTLSFFHISIQLSFIHFRSLLRMSTFGCPDCISFNVCSPIAIMNEALPISRFSCSSAVSVVSVCNCLASSLSIWILLGCSNIAWLNLSQYSFVESLGSVWPASRNFGRLFILGYRIFR